MYNKFTLIVLAILVLIFLHSTWGVYQKKRASEEMKNVSVQNVQELRQRDQELQAKIDRLGTTIGVEEEIRSKFSVAKEGENVVLVVEDQNLNTASSTQNQGFWSRIMNFFRNKK